MTRITGGKGTLQSSMNDDHHGWENEQELQARDFK